MDMEAMMKVYREYGTPGAPHIMLSRMAGSWKTSMKTWMDPSKPPMEHSGVSEQKMILDGRYLQDEEAVELMGAPYRGLGITGFDNFAKKFTMFWLDSMNTRTQIFEGAAGVDGKSIEMLSYFEDPVRGAMKNRALIKLIDRNTYTFEMYAEDKSGVEAKMMEITYTRQR